MGIGDITKMISLFTGAGVKAIFETNDLSSILAQLKGQEAPAPMLRSAADFVQHLLKKQDAFPLALEFCLDTATSHGMPVDKVLGVMEKLAPMVGLPISQAPSDKQKIGDYVVGLSTQIRPPNERYFGAICECPSCRFQFLI